MCGCAMVMAAGWGMESGAEECRELGLGALIYDAISEDALKRRGNYEFK